MRTRVIPRGRCLTAAKRGTFVLSASDVECCLDGAMELGAHAACRREPVDDAAVTSDQNLVEVPGRHAERAGLPGGPAIERMRPLARHDFLVGERKGHVEIGLAEFLD